MSQCIDPIVGKILAGWRYDISGLAPEMRGDYEEHFAACERCRSKQRLHRTIDVSLIALASVSAGVFLLAFGVILISARAMPSGWSLPHWHSGVLEKRTIPE